jgi:hypothetical protein
MLYYICKRDDEWLESEVSIMKNELDAVKVITECLRMYVLFPELTAEFNQKKIEWADEKAFNETLTMAVIAIETMTK